MILRFKVREIKLYWKFFIDSKNMPTNLKNLAPIKNSIEKHVCKFFSIIASYSLFLNKLMGAQLALSFA